MAHSVHTKMECDCKIMMLKITPLWFLWIILINRDGVNGLIDGSTCLITDECDFQDINLELLLFKLLVCFAELTEQRAIA